MNKKWFAWLGGTIGTAVAANYGWRQFRDWQSRTWLEMIQDSTLIFTERGSMEYATLGSGKPVLILHGSPGGYNQSLVTAKNLDLTKLQATAVSRPGYLRSPLTTGRTPEEQADAYAALMDKLGIEKTAVIAESGGGPSGIQFALRHPDRITALVLISAIIRYGPEAPLPPIIQPILQSPLGELPGILRHFPHAILQFMFQNKQNQERVATDPAKINMVRDMLGSTRLMSHRAKGLINDFEQFALMPPYPVEEIKAPVLILHGTADTAATFNNVEYFINRVPHATLHTYPDAGHLFFVPHRDTVYSEINQFLIENG